jgi:uncharacterized protein YceH (UPF0502 family)
MSLVGEGSRISTAGVHPLTPSTEVTLVESNYLPTEYVLALTSVLVTFKQRTSSSAKSFRIRDSQLNEHVHHLHQSHLVRT